MSFSWREMSLPQMPRQKSIIYIKMKPHFSYICFKAAKNPTKNGLKMLLGESLSQKYWIMYLLRYHLAFIWKNFIMQSWKMFRNQFLCLFKQWREKGMIRKFSTARLILRWISRKNSSCGIPVFKIFDFKKKLIEKIITWREKNFL